MGKKIKSNLGRDEVLRIIEQHKEDFAQRYGVTKIGIFGSMAKGTNVADSDVDVVIEMKKPDLFFMVHIKDELEEVLHCNVDLIQYRKKMNAFLKKRIQQEAVYV